MTLIVYKQGMIAADSRMSSKHAEGKECTTCPKCNEKTTSLVNDDRNKITIIPKDKKYMFENDRILVYAAAGNVRTSSIMKKIIEVDEDLKAVLTILAKYNTDPDFPFAQLLMVGEKFTYRASLGGKGFRIVKNLLSDTVVLGSGKDGVDWIDHISGGILSPVDLVIRVKEREESVGGPVKYVRLDTEDLKIETVDESKPRTFDLENIQKAIHAIVPKPAAPVPTTRNRPLKRKVNA